MDPSLKKILKAVTLELRHLLEGKYDSSGGWQPGDLEDRLSSIGVWRDRDPIPADELGHLSEQDKQARTVVDAYLGLRREAGIAREEAVAEFVRETAYTWANRLLALRCMESRGLIDEVVLQKEVYGGRSLKHNRLAQRHPELCTGEDDGLFVVLDEVFRERAATLPTLFDPDTPAIALRPSPAVMKQCVGLLSGTLAVRSADPATADVFAAPDALGWAYQYWNTEEKDRVFERVRTVKGAKIAGADIIPATQLYTEDYMVKFLVQNSLGATWMGMHPDSKLYEEWEYYVRDADRAPVVERNSFRSSRASDSQTSHEDSEDERNSFRSSRASDSQTSHEDSEDERNEFRSTRKVAEITFLDPACGSGHFLIEAFDLYYSMYEEEGALSEPEEICRSILENNLFGIDIDERSVQIAEAALWMKAAERAFEFDGAPTGLAAAVSSHLKGERWEQFLDSFEKEPSVPRVLRRFAQSMEHIDEIGSLARPAEDLRAIIKEEHATWERQVREQKEANFLFAEMNADALSGQLPFHEISNDDFGDRLFYRAQAGIDAFTERARVAGDFEDEMLGSETQAGFRLVDLLSRRYDVVAANPPYMGSKNMGPALRRYVEAHYKAGKRDLYAAFMLRNAELAADGGRVAMVTQQSWMFLRSFVDLRAVDAEKLAALKDEEPRGLLRDTTLETLAHLGEHAFEDSSAAGAFVVVFVLATCVPTVEHRLTAFRLIGPKSPEEKDELLRAAIHQSNSVVSHPLQRRFLDIPQTPLCYWLRERFFTILAEHEQLGNVSTIKEGIGTGDGPRFIRYFWECTSFTTNSRWRAYQKGGGTTRWAGQCEHAVAAGLLSIIASDQKFNGARIQNLDYMRRPGMTSSRMARGTFAWRVLNAGWYFDKLNNSLFIDVGHSSGMLGCILNSHVATYLIRILTRDLNFYSGNITRIPIPQTSLQEQGATSVEFSIGVKSELVRDSLTEWSYEPGGEKEIISKIALNAVLLAVEGSIEAKTVALYELDDGDTGALLEDTGTPAGWFPLISGYDRVPTLPDSPSVPAELLAPQADHAQQTVSPVSLAEVKRRLRAWYEAGPGATVDDDDDEGHDGLDAEDDESVAVGARIPIPPETFLEELCQKTELHPISVYWLLREGIEEEGWRCLPEERRLWGDRITVTVLRFLGHRWPKQIEASEPVPDWADPDGIVPMSSIAKEATLVERVDQLLTADEMDSRDFAEMMGKPLDAWLSTEFFKHHTRQFKKRPIAWQLQSGSFTTRSTPAFACLAYYHKVNADALPKIRSQYVGPLRQRMETELRGIASVVPDARTDRQDQRRVELDDAVAELQKFDAILEAVITSGFGPTPLIPKLRQYAIDDAMLSLKSRWLHRLSELIVKTSLTKWLSAADRSGLHPELANWIQDAMTHLDHHCTRVGPDAPDQEKLKTDPVARDLAPLISPHAHSMRESSLKMACVVWWKPFEDAVLGPLKEQVKQLKAEQKECQAALKADPGPSPADVRKLKARVKEIKAEVKELNEEIEKKTAPARVIREQIEEWRSDEPRTWGEWLAEQPLFDQISSLDDRRAPPTTIAQFVAQESQYAPDINDGVRVNIAPLQKAGLLAADVLAKKDVDKAIADRAEWRADERRWVREGKLPQCGWWPESGDNQ